MEGGRIFKCSCRPQQLTVTPNSETIRCPSCLTIHSVQTKQLLSPEKGKISSGLRGLGTKLKIKISGNVSPKAESLNCKPSEPARRHNKRALLCGVTYEKRRYKLKGTINDVKNMRDLLVHIFNYPVESIRVLTEEEPDPEFTPTRKNIQKALKWLVEGCQAGDSLVFYFSGHGLRQPDFNGDERDGFDETLCPVDFKKEGMILDNDINSIIVQPLKKGVTLHAIVDACHSGTILDLSYVYNKEKKTWEDNSPPSGANKKTSGGLAISLSACEDHQIAADTSAFSEGKEMNGAMTSSFIKAIKNNRWITYGELLDTMHEIIEKANNAGCLKSHILKKLFHNTIFQDSQLSSSEEFDIYSKKFKL